VWIKELEIYNSFRYNKQVYNTFLIVVKRYIDVAVKFVKGLIDTMFYKRHDIDAKFSKADIEVKFEGTR